MTLQTHTVVQDTQHLDHAFLIMDTKNQLVPPPASMASHMQCDHIITQLRAPAYIDQLRPFVQGRQGIIDDVGVRLQLQRPKLLKRPIKDIFDILSGLISEAYCPATYPCFASTRLLMPLMCERSDAASLNSVYRPASMSAIPTATASRKAASLAACSASRA